MEGSGALKNVGYVVGPEGRRAAVQLGIEDRKALLDYLAGLCTQVRPALQARCFSGVASHTCRGSPLGAGSMA